MVRRVTQISLFALLAFVALSVVLAAGFMWRLSQGPVPLTFLKQTVENTINASLNGMTMRIDDVIVERDDTTRRPRFRLRDIQLVDAEGSLIARAPRAAVDVDASGLLTASVVPRKLDLIGARILIRHKRDGTIQLGFGDARAGGTPTQGGAASGDSSDRSEERSGLPAGETAGRNLLELINSHLSRSEGEGSAVAGLESVQVSQASISLYDEINDTVWFAPRANLVFKRVPYGFALFADASIATGKRPWRTEVIASFKHDTRTFNIDARIFDLVPADIAENVFALSKFAQVRLPLSGHADIEFTDKGVMTRANAVFKASAGRVGFPDYISEPIIIDEGLLRLDYDPQTGDIVIGNSAIYIGGNQAELQGRIQPKRDADGRINALGLVLGARNVSIDSMNEGDDPVALDRIEFKGTALLDTARLDVDDLILMAGKTGVRMRGRFVGEKEGIGVYLGGRIRDLPVGIVKKIWPPLVSPGARNWIRRYVHQARIPKGVFRLNVPAADLLAAIRDDVVLPDEVLDFRFDLTNVVTGYYHDLPAVEGLSGKAHLRGNHFDMRLTGGTVTLPSGGKLQVHHGTMSSVNLAAKVTPAVIEIAGSGRAGGFLELFDLNPLRLISEAGFNPKDLTAVADLKLRFDVPLSKQLTPDQIKVAADAGLKSMKFKGAGNDMLITGEAVNLVFKNGKLSAEGRLGVNGVPADIKWSRLLAKNDQGRDKIELTATLSDEDRQKFGVDLSEYVRGPLKVKLNADALGGDIRSARVDADLSRATLFANAISWRKKAGKGARARFKLEIGDKRTAIRDLDVKGSNLRIRGDVVMTSDGNLISASLPTVVLDENNQLAVVIKQNDGRLAIAATGKSFDARPLISGMFGDDTSKPAETQPISINATIATVYANRGEVISNVRGSLNVVGGYVQQADMRGTYRSGEPVSMKIIPAGGGLRDLRIVGRDSGATLRAANLYSKVHGGTIDFHAILGRGGDATIRKGLLVVRNFSVRNERAIATIDNKAAEAQRRAGPRRSGLKFTKLTVPFSVDRRFVRIGDALIQGLDLGASAQGVIRKQDGAMDIGGTIIPAYALNAALGEVPIVGQLLVGGRGQGLFGLNFALQGSMRQPRFTVNPVSAIAPGFLRRLFDIGGGGVRADGTAIDPRQRRKRRRNKPSDK